MIKNSIQHAISYSKDKEAIKDFPAENSEFGDFDIDPEISEFPEVIYEEGKEDKIDD